LNLDYLDLVQITWLLY